MTPLEQGGYHPRIDRRRLILRVLLWSLAIAAAAGVLAVLLPIDDVMFRVMWTGFATAVSAGLILPLSLLLDRARRRPAGLFALSTVVLEFVLTLAVIWIVWLLPGGGSRLDEELGLTIFFVAVSGLPVFLLLLAVRIAAGRIMAAAGTATSLTAFIGFMLAIWLPGGTWQHDDWWGTAWTILGFGLLIALALAGVGTGPPRRHWRWLGVAGSVIAAALVVLGIWTRSNTEETVVITAGLGATVAYAVALLHMRLRSGQRWVRAVSICTAAVTALAIALAVFTDGGFAEELFLRLAAAGGILTGCGSMAIIILLAFNRRGDVDHRSADVEGLDVTVVCPRCRRTQQVALGGARCAGCGLRITIRIEEPRCPQCDYLLYQLTSGRCPECGYELTASEAAPPPAPA